MEITRDDGMGAGENGHIKTCNKLPIELAQQQLMIQLHENLLDLTAVLHISAKIG